MLLVSAKIAEKNLLIPQASVSGFLTQIKSVETVVSLSQFSNKFYSILRDFKHENKFMYSF